MSNAGSHRVLNSLIEPASTVFKKCFSPVGEVESSRFFMRAIAVYSKKAEVRRQHFDTLSDQA